MKQDQLKAWQPAQFDRFVRILEQNQLNHAYLFSGFFGSLEMAQFLAKSLFCTDKVGVLPCEKCRNCKLIEQGEFPDVTLIKPVNQSLRQNGFENWWGSFLKQGLKVSNRSLSLNKLRKCIPTQLILCSRSSKNPRVRFTFFS